MLVSEMHFLRDHWYPVAVVDDLDAPLAVRLFGDDYVVWPTGDGAFASSDPFCPHRSAHLSGGWVDDGHIVCPYHGWTFDGTGACTHIPQATPGLPVPPRAALRTYPTAAAYGVVWMCVGDQPVSDAPPVWREAVEHPDWRFHVEFFEPFAAAAPRIIDNNLDQSHVAYVHQNTFGDPDDAALPPLEVEPTEGGGFHSRMHASQRGVGVQNGQTDDESERLDRWTDVELLAPLTTRTRLEYDGSTPDYAFFSCATPVDDRHSIYMRLTALAGTEAVQPWETFHAFGTRVKEEDRVVLESTVADFPVDVTSEVHLRCDKVTLEYRRYLMRQLEQSPSPVPTSTSV